MVKLDLLIKAGGWPSRSSLRKLAKQAIDAALAETGLRSAGETELSLVFTDDAHIKMLNGQWRGQDKPTNVLSFPGSPLLPLGLPPLLGDIVLACETVKSEAVAAKKPLEHHIAHLIVHGFLHLAGHDHARDVDAEIMEDLERQILARLAIPDPYA